MLYNSLTALILFLFLSFGYSFEQFCINNHEFDAKWIYEQGFEKSNPFTRCPVAHSDPTYIPRIAAHFQKYQCSRFRPAELSPLGCEIRPMGKSFDMLNQLYTNGSFVFVGDSLSLQQYVALLCDLEDTERDSKTLNYKYVSSFFLRPGLPCSGTCMTNETFRQEDNELYEKKARIMRFCDGCPLGISKDGVTYADPHSTVPGATVSAAQHWWDTSIPADSRVVVLNTGAAYTFSNGLDRPLKQYLKTLIDFKPVLAKAIQKGIVVAWMPIPLPSPGVSTKKQHNRHLLEHMNAAVREHLSPLGVIYVDNVSPLTLARKVYDRGNTIDDLHWCNLGRNTIPSVINQVYLHFIIQQAGSGWKEISNMAAVQNTLSTTSRPNGGHAKKHVHNSKSKH